MIDDAELRRQIIVSVGYMHPDEPLMGRDASMPLTDLVSILFTDSEFNLVKALAVAFALAKHIENTK